LPKSFSLVYQLLTQRSRRASLPSFAQKRKLTIPSDLAYGDDGSGEKIPGGSTLTFDVEMLDIKEKKAKARKKGKKKKKAKKAKDEV
jgi:hypothetical protein